MKLIYVDNFRTIAILLIVLNHTLSLFNWDNETIIGDFFIVLAEGTTALFMLVSGFLFAYLSASFKFKKYMRNKIKYVGLPYLFCSIPAIVYFTLFSVRDGGPEGFYDDSTFLQVINFYLTGLHLAPYWYIPAIFIFFIFSPAFIYLYDKKLLLYALPFLLFISLTIGRDGIILSAIHFLSVYVSGMLMWQYSDVIKRYLMARSLALGLLLVTFVNFLQFYYGVYSLPLMFSSGLLLSIWSMLFLSYAHNTALFKFDISYSSFGIFFIHSYIISTIKILIGVLQGEEFLGFDGSWYGPIIALIVIVSISHLIVLLFRRVLGGKSRYFIGS